MGATTQNNRALDASPTPPASTECAEIVVGKANAAQLLPPLGLRLRCPGQGIGDYDTNRYGHPCTRTGLVLPRNYFNFSWQHLPHDLACELGYPHQDSLAELGYGAILSYMCNTNDLTLSQNDAFAALHLRCAWVGLTARVGYAPRPTPSHYGGLCIYVTQPSSSFAHIGPPNIIHQEPFVPFNSHEIMCAIARAHTAIDTMIHFKTHCILPLHFRKWHEMIDDYAVEIYLAPTLRTLSPTRQTYSWLEVVQVFIDAARGGERIALDTEGVRVGEELVTISFYRRGSFFVLIEEAPFTTLRQLLDSDRRLVHQERHPDSPTSGSDSAPHSQPGEFELLVFGNEANWLRSHNLDYSRADLRDLQDVPCFRRDNVNFREHYDYENDIEYRDRSCVSLPEALAIGRGRRLAGHESLYVKAANGNKFFYPDGIECPSIWAARPLAVSHLKYAAADVVALFILEDAVTPQTHPLPLVMRTVRV